MSCRYVEYEQSRTVPNVVVDGSPNDGTVLTLTHWPGIGRPAGLERDLSAQMAFEFVRSGRTVDAEVVTNNHFDQDGLVSMYALIDPEVALPLEDLLVDLAAAGDFSTYVDRRAARASMTLAAFADPVRSPLGSELEGRPYGEQCGILYAHCLDLLPELVLEAERWSDLWEEEDRHLSASEEAIAAGSIVIDERRDLDLVIVTVDADEPTRRGHRFAGNEHVGVHPMAVNNATRCFRILEVHGRRFTYTDRYESWVQYRSRRPLPRVDLRPLAEELADLDDSGSWTATAPSSLTPQLTTDGESGLAAAEVEQHIIRHLRSAPVAWDPYAAAS